MTGPDDAVSSDAGMRAMIEAHDWSRTPLGSRKNWPDRLKAVIEVILDAPLAMSVRWGADLTQIHNDAYQKLAARFALGRLGEPTPASALEFAPSAEDVFGAIGRGESRSFADQASTGPGEDGPAAARLDITHSPLRDADGRVAGILTTLVESTRRRASGGERERSDRQLLDLVEGMPQIVWRADSAGRCIWISPHWVRFTGLSPEESRGEGWLQILHPDDRPAILERWSGSRGGASFEMRFRLREAATGTYRWFQTRALPSFDETGAISQWYGTSTDIDEMHQLEERQRLLTDELQHRVRNSLAVIRSIARRTGETATSVEDFAMHLEGRIDAINRVLSAATSQPEFDVPFLDLVANELVASQAREGETFFLDGPNLRLPPRFMEIVALTIHELATNAIKFGALATSSGRIDVTWQVESAGKTGRRLVIEWKESGVTIGSPPTRRGFGTQLLERTLAYQLRADVRQIFEPDGLRCLLALPLPGDGDIRTLARG